ncbi:MAG: AarF/UbiB family protein [Alkalispirochaetaceae bacterium]
MKPRPFLTSARYLEILSVLANYGFGEVLRHVAFTNRLRARRKASRESGDERLYELPLPRKARCVLEELERQLKRELDFRRERLNIQRFRRYFLDNPNIYVPNVYDQLCGANVVTLDYVEGTRRSEFLRNHTLPFAEATVVVDRITELILVLSEFGIKVPLNLSYILKSFVLLEEVAATLDPEYKTIEKLQEFSREILLHRFAPGPALRRGRRTLNRR